MKEEIRIYLQKNGILTTDAKIETLEEAKEWIKTLDDLTPSDEIIERCKREGALELNDEGEWVTMEMYKG
jgi:hypothetical protein